MIVKMTRLAALAALGLGVSACGNQDAAHLVFGQQQTLGLQVALTAPEQGGTFSLGYKDRNIAVVPVAIKKGTDGAYDRLGSTNNYGVYVDENGKVVRDPNAGEVGDRNDAYSTFGQFEIGVDANGNAVTPTVSLGKFFATGIAAQTLAEGFKAKLGGEASDD